MHPHFDEDRIIWNDEYAGRYSPPPPGYAEQFELQWKLALHHTDGYDFGPGVGTDESYIAERVYEWLGHGVDGKSTGIRPRMARPLDYPIDPNLIAGKQCIDIGCGMGRWTRAMLAIGASSVLSVDISESAVRSVSKANDRVARADIMNIPAEHPEWVEKFDFCCLWGVAMHTHDPLKTFLSAASTVRPGGSLYLMVYCPEGMHNRKAVNSQRRTFHSLGSLDARLKYVNHVYRREFDFAYPVSENIRNQLLRFAGVFIKSWRGTKIGVLDMLEPYYNWVIPRDVISGWARKGGFTRHRYLYKRPRSSYHVLLTKAPDHSG